MLACEAVRQQQESRRLHVKQEIDKAQQDVCVVVEVPDETEALDTEMVGASEFVLWWPAAFFSGAPLLECKLATLSAPSGCVQTEIHTQAVKTTI